ncbi:hypothetical protein HanPSC8_Chr09g0364911 [Helianthus annuus]|nr:hypothetical protein HanPSC8_Chr09g0364911 [Helianthus annuus]
MVALIPSSSSRLAVSVPIWIAPFSSTRVPLGTERLATNRKAFSRASPHLDLPSVAPRTLVPALGYPSENNTPFALFLSARSMASHMLQPRPILELYGPTITELHLVAIRNCTGLAVLACNHSFAQRHPHFLPILQKLWHLPCHRNSEGCNLGNAGRYTLYPRIHHHNRY